MNFFEIVAPHLSSLSNNERGLFDYVVENMDEVKKMSVREAAAATFVSSATFLRFIKKIGFSGFGEFTTVLKFTMLNQDTTKTTASFTVKQHDYREEYLKNIEESVRVISAEKMHEMTSILHQSKDIFLLSKGISKHAAEYVNYLYSMAGFNMIFPTDHDYRQQVYKRIDSESIVFIMTYAGEDSEFLELFNIFSRKNIHPTVISITEPNNNTIQNLSDYNFYIFTDTICLNGVDVSSRISSVSVMELLLYQYVEDYHLNMSE